MQAEHQCATDWPYSDHTLAVCWSYLYDMIGSNVHGITHYPYSGIYDKAKKQPELFLSQVDGFRSNPEKLGSAKLDVHDHANKKVTGQTYEQDDTISINLRNNKVSVQLHI